MKEPKLQTHPDYKLLTQSDIVAFFHMQMPRWLFFDPKYRHLSLEAKVAYTFLLNRFQLSRMNGWINADNEVFIIFPREKLAEEMGVSYKKAIACFKELLEAELIWEHRVGRGSANRVYMAAVVLSGDSAHAHESAPFSSQEQPQEPQGTAGQLQTRDAEMAGLEDAVKNEDSAAPTTSSGTPLEDIPDPQYKECENGTPGYAVSALPDLPFLHPSKIDFSNKDFSQKEKVSPSCRTRERQVRLDSNGQADDKNTPGDETALSEILDRCDLEVLPREEAGVFRNAITRLYYSESFRTGGAVLPRAVIRSHLRRLEGMVLLDTREKLRRNVDKQVKNSTAYLMTALLNNIWEVKSDLMVDPYLNAMAI